MENLEKVTEIEDLRRIAERKVPHMFYDYVDSGSWTETTYRNNESDFNRIKLRQRVLVNMDNLIRRAKEANCSALILTADLQVLGQQHKDIKNGLSAPPKPTLTNILNLMTKPQWCLKWGGKLIIKGIMEPKDAIIAARNGADALVVSNHGGRQLDGALFFTDWVLMAKRGCAVRLKSFIKSVIYPWRFVVIRTLIPLRIISW